MNGFTEVSQNEMMEVDAGGWFRSFCVAAGAVIGVAVAIKTGAGVTAGAGLTIAGAACGDQVGKMVEDAYYA